MSDPSGAKWRPVAAVVLLVLAGVLIFTRLGHYPLWDDEATTAMFGRNVLKTGDTSAVVGHNIIAYRNGRELVDLKLRYLPPLHYYVVAAGAAVMGESDCAARCPFALAGLLTIVLIVRWMWRERAGPLIWTGMSVALLCNVSLLLFVRQCRYYALAIFFSTLVTYLYLNWNGRPRGLLLLSAASLALLASNYLNFVALYVVLGADYLLFERRERRLKPTDWGLLLGPLIAVGTPIALIFNPLGKGIVVPEDVSWISKHLTLLGWNLRDLVRCEFGVGLLLIAAPLLGIRAGDSWLRRAVIALVVYILVISSVSPQPVTTTKLADVRYLIPLIPLCAYVGVRVICLVTRGRWWLALPIMLACFGTNVAHGTWIKRFAFPNRQGPHSTIVEYCRELIQPQRSPFGETAEWVNQHVPRMANVWVVPAHYLYPLMLYAPHPLYGYQLVEPVHAQFDDLPGAHVIGRVPPDFVICFGQRGWEEWGPNSEDLARIGVRYTQVGYIDVLGVDRTRPELFWHEFKTVTRFDKATQGVYVFRRVGAPVVGQRGAVAPED